MSSTRLAPEGAPISYERYMSSPEFSEMRGIPGTTVAAKAQLYSSARVRSLLFFLQSLSLRDGGLRRVARDLSKTSTLGCEDQLPRLLVEFCINPKLVIESSDGCPEKPNGSRDRKRVKCHEIPELERVTEALLGYQRSYEAKVRSDFVITTIARQILETLDHGLAIRKMVVIEGDSGTGKTTATEAWCAAHQGQARFVSLSGITHKTGFFQKIASAIGLASSKRKATDMQIKVEEFFRRTQLMLVIDEAHYLFPQHQHRNSSPELVDWVTLRS